ncbi:hypothetical protein [Streptomyces sp. McG3]|uniref:hypothetical protein n=1 Tax=Streptomyces sp. McG3 TaxID=2725483 RepID=UPI001BE7AEFB|nr:hypothetical protein [Streptomyces sp. McG3]
MARRVLLTLGPSDAEAAVAWATRLRAERRIEEYSPAPATLEDVYLAATAPSAAATTEDAAHA